MLLAPRETPVTLVPLPVPGTGAKSASLGAETAAETASKGGQKSGQSANAQPPGVLAPDFVTQHERNLTGLAEALAFYKSGNLVQGDLAAASASDETVKITLEWVALRSFPREAGFDRIQAFMQAHPAWPALDWLKRRSEEALYGDRKSNGLIKA
ncbi:MAG TPA: hypothetical protein VFF88_07455, partial [Methylocella sp.]|nr:hypothetical protein [Methylocella sp.]